MRLSGSLPMTAILSLAALHAEADRVVIYVIDSEQTRITFNWTYMGITSPTASFSRASGHIYANLDDPDESWAEVTIPVTTLKTFMPAIDRQLLESGHFFKPREYPDMHFRSNGMMHVDKDERTFSLVGSLTVNGITRPVILNAKALGSGANPFASNGPSAAGGHDQLSSQRIRHESHAGLDR